MKKILEYSRYLVLIAVVFSLLASLAGFLMGAIRTIETLITLARSYSSDSSGIIGLLRLMDTFLIATVLFIFSAGLYDLFIQKVSITKELRIESLQELEARLGGLIILVMALTFLEHFVEWDDASTTLFMALGFAVVSAAIIAFRHFSKKK